MITFRYLLAALLLLSSAALLLAPSPAVDNSALTWVDASSPAAITYRRFQDQFGSDEVFVVRLSGKKMPTLLRHIDAFNRILEADPVIERVISAKTPLGPRWTELERIVAQGSPISAGMLDTPLNRALELLKTDDAPAAVLFGLSRLTSADQRAGLKRSLEDERASAQSDGLKVQVAGNPLVNLELDRAGDQVERVSMPILIAVCVVLLLVLSRSIPVTMVTLVPAGLTVKATEGLFGFFGISTNIVVNIAKPLLFVLLLAGTLHMLVGWQDATAAGFDRDRAPWRAMKQKSKAILFALFTTAIGFGSLVLSDVPPIRHFGLLSAGGLLLGAAYVLVLFPAVLRFVPPPIRRGESLASIAVRLSGWGIRRKWLIPAAAVVVVGLGLWLADDLTSDPHAIRYFKKNHPLRIDHESLEKQGVGLATAEAVISSPISLLSAQGLRSLTALSNALRALPSVRQVIDPALLIEEAAHHTIPMVNPLTDADLASLLSRHRDELADFASGDGKQIRLSLLIGTLDASDLDSLHRQIDKLFKTVLDLPNATLTITGNYEILLSTQAGLLQTLKSSLLLTAALMMLLFLVFLRSVRVTLVALVPNLFPVCLNFILMSLIDMPLDVGTAMTAAIALGIAVDDTLHFTLAWDPNHPRRTARSTGRAIVMSSIVIGAGFLSLIASDFTPTRNFGILCGVAMVSAILADLIILPPLLKWAAPPKLPRKETER